MPAIESVSAHEMFTCLKLFHLSDDKTPEVTIRQFFAPRFVLVRSAGHDRGPVDEILPVRYRQRRR